MRCPRTLGAEAKRRRANPQPSPSELSAAKDDLTTGGPPKAQAAEQFRQMELRAALGCGCFGGSRYSSLTSRNIAMASISTSNSGRQSLAWTPVEAGKG